jgi:hypothetical protein
MRTVAILARLGQRHLALQVEVLLPAGAELMRDAVRRGFDGGRGIGTPDHLRGDDVLAEFQRALDGQHGLELLDRGPHGGGGAQRLVARGGDHDRHGLAGELDGGLGEERLAAGDRADIVLARHVASRDHRDDARHGACGVEPQREEAPVRHGRERQRGVQRARHLRDVVGVARLAGRVLQRAVMAQRGAGALPGQVRLRRGAGQRRGAVHHATSSAVTSAGRSGRVARRCRRRRRPCATASR